MGQQGSLGPKKWVNWGQRGLKLLVGVSVDQKVGQLGSPGPENGSVGVNRARKWVSRCQRGQ